MPSLSPKLWYHLPIVNIIYPKNWKLSTNCSWDNEGEKKQGEKKPSQKKIIQKTNKQTKKKTDSILKIESCELIPYIANLTGLFIFLGVNSKRKSRRQKWEICLN